jgi:SPP1 family phage portal protein
MNTIHLQDIVKGQYGREIAYTDVEEITENNIISVVASCIGVFNTNKRVFKYLWDYKNGDQPIRYRKKIIRDDVNNPIVENHAWEIVRFKNGQTNGEPIQCVCTNKDKEINKQVDKFNDYCKATGKHSRDISSGEWTSATGTGFKAVQRKINNDIPFRITVPTPMNTFIIYSSHTEEPMLAVQELKDENQERYFLCFSETREYRIKNSQLMVLGIDGEGNEIKSRLHAFGGIPIIEYPNNQCRISDIELVIDMLDAINNMQSNRMDAIEQFVQSWVKFINCSIDEEQFKKMKMMGALVVKSNNGEGNKADVDIMSQELNQTESQVAKDDLWNNALSISAIPNKQGNTGGDTQGAVELRNGWDFSKQAAKLKDPYVIDSERRLNAIIRTVIRQSGKEDFSFTEMDYDVQISHSPTDNMQVKSQVYQMLVSSGIHPLIAIKTCGLWTDSEKVFLLSKPYLDVLYKTIDETVENAKEQEKKAKELIKKNKNSLEVN